VFLLARAVSHVRGRGEYCSTPRLLTRYDPDGLWEAPETTWLAGAFRVALGMCCSVHSEKCSKNKRRHWVKKSVYIYIYILSDINKTLAIFEHRIACGTLKTKKTEALFGYSSIDPNSRVLRWIGV
jgi:hypothetical protein